MVVITPTGKLVKVNKVLICVERKLEFNGKIAHLKEFATDLSCNPTGLKFYISDNKVNCWREDELYIGNLSTEKVKEILNTLLKDGSYNLSDMEYQKEKSCNLKDLVLDGGESLPYFEEDIHTNVFEMPSCHFTATPAFESSCPMEDADFDEDEDDDESYEDDSE